MEKKARPLHDDEKLLLESIEGMAAFQILLPLMRDIAIYIATGGGVPPQLRAVPELKSEVELAKLEFKRNRQRERR